MPIFRYVCNRCKAGFELLLPRFDSKAECPACGSEDLEKAPNKVGITHAGSKGCAARHECPSAGKCGCGGGCGHAH